MIVKPQETRETVASKVLTRARDYGIANPVGPTFDRIFNREKTERQVSISKNMVGQSKSQITSPDGYGAFTPTIGIQNSTNIDPKRIIDVTAENQIHLYWRKNRERKMKYDRVSSRAEIAEALDNICDESIYKDDLGSICSLKVDPDVEIGQAVKEKLHKIFRRDLLKRVMNFDKDGWYLMRNLLIDGRLFLEVMYDEKSNEITGVSLLPSQNMIIINQGGIILGYRQMIEGAFADSGKTSGRNYVDFSPNQILYVDLRLYGPGGINDPRSILEPAIKPFNQLNCIEDSIVMYRIQWGSEKLVFNIDVNMMPTAKAQKHIKDQAKVLSRKIDYNTSTGEVTNNGRVIGLGEHYFMPKSTQTSGSSIERLDSGDNISRIEDLKYFKRNLVNSMHVPPGRITALAGDGDNYSGGKIGEVTQAEVSFARMVQRYQMPLDILLSRLYVMILNTKNDISQDIKSEDNFSVQFNKANEFQNYMNAQILNTNLDTFDKVMKSVRTVDNPGGVLSVKYALTKALRMSDQDATSNEQWLKEEGEKTSENPEQL
jgi:hypothetical protein